MALEPIFTDDTFGSSDALFRKEVGEYLTVAGQAQRRTAFEERAKALVRERFRQDAGAAASLRQKYSAPVLGRISIYEALLRLAECVDETDTELYCVSQLVHCLQTAEGLEAAGVRDQGMILAALIHDLGKIALLVGARPEHVNGPTEPLGANPAGCGLDHATLMWNHDEFAYERVRAYVPDYVAWLVRYHSLRFDCATDLMDARDWRYFRTYLPTFRKHDLGTKSLFAFPRKSLADYRGLLETYFPDPILI